MSEDLDSHLPADSLWHLMCSEATMRVVKENLEWPMCSKFSHINVKWLVFSHEF